MRSHGTRAQTPQAYATSRRGGLSTTASAALVCLGVLLTAGCGGGGDDGYVAVGAAEQSQRDSGDPSSGPVRPDDKVRMVPLEPAEESGSAANGPGDDDAASKGDKGRDGKSAGGGTDGGSGDAAGDGGDGGKSDGGDSDSGGSEGGSPGSGTPSGDSTAGGGGGGGSSSPSPGGGTGEGDGSGGDGDAKPSGPAALKVGEPRSAKAGDRWCEKVTVRFHNAGGSPVKKGTVTLSTHIVGSLGVDWDTRTSTRALPVPLGAGEKKNKTWNVCVDKWRVPMGMHVETREVRVSGWK